MPESDEQRPSGPPDYKVYKSRKGLLARFRKPDLSSLRKGSEKPPRLDRKADTSRSRVTGKRVLKWVGLAAAGLDRAQLPRLCGLGQIQPSSSPAKRRKRCTATRSCCFSPQTILVIGTDARSPDTAEPGHAPTQECFEQQAHGDAPHGACSVGQFRADTLMLIRAGGGKFRKLSIPRDSYAEIPGQNPQKINAAYALRRRQGARSKRSRTSSTSRSTTSRSSTSAASKT